MQQASLCSTFDKYHKRTKQEIFLTKMDINFDVAHNYESKAANSKSSGFSFDNRASVNPLAQVGVYKNKANGNGSSDTITGTQLSVGGSTIIATTVGDITLTGSNVVGNGDVSINAARNLTIQSGQDTTSNENRSNNKAIGTVVISDTERFGGYHNEKHNDNGASINQVSANVASLGGNVNLRAGKDYTQTASNVMAANDVNVTAQTIILNTAENTGTHHADDKDLKIGTFARVSSPIIDLINNIDAARKSDGRLQTMQGMATVANAYQAGSAISSMTGGPGSGSLISAEVGFGFTTKKNEENSTYNIAQGSSIKGGGNVNLTSTQGDIHATGATLTAGKTLGLDSANDIILDAGKSTANSDGKRSGYGVEVGVGVSVGAQTGVYAYVAAQASKGKSKSDSTTYSNTHLAADTINIKSKGNTTLKGADATANTINADVGGKLAIESVQDKVDSMSKDTGVNARVQISFGTAWSASGGVNQSKSNGSYLGVNQQSGLFAGNGGYHIKADSVDLKGGAITSTNAANSDLTANALTVSNLQNRMNFSGSTASIRGGVSGNTNSGVQNAPNQNTPTMGDQASGIGQSLTNISKWDASGGTSFSSSLPMSETGSDSSTTYGTLTDGNITIGGKSVTAAETGAHTDAATAHTAIGKLPDLKVLLEDQKAMAAAAGTVIAVSKQVSDDIAASAEKAKAEAQEAMLKDNAKLQAQYNEVMHAKTDLIEELKDDATTPERAKEISQTLTAINGAERALFNQSPDYVKASAALEHWGLGGDYSRALSAVTQAVVGGVAGQGGTQVLANSLAPYASTLIGQQFDHSTNPNKAAQVLSHALLGAVLAYTNGGNATGGALAGAGGELAADYLMRNLYPEAFDANGVFHRDLITEAQANSIAALSAGVGAFVAGTTGGSIYDGAVGGNVAYNAVVNNDVGSSLKGRLSPEVFEKYIAEKVEDCVKQGKSDCVIAYRKDGAFENNHAYWAGKIEHADRNKKAMEDTVRTLNRCINNGGSEQACGEQMRNNDNGVRTLLSLLPLVGEGEAFKILFTGTDINGEEASRWWGAFGIATGGVGQKLRGVQKALQTEVNLTKKLAQQGDNAAHNAQRAPIDYDGHILRGEVKPNGKVVGGHSTVTGEVRTIQGSESAPNAFGVYDAKIEVLDSATGKWVAKSNGNPPGTSTMFPKNWSADKIKSEVDVAFANKTVLGGGKWFGTTPSGVKVEGFLSPNTTVYPVSPSRY